MHTTCLIAMLSLFASVAIAAPPLLANEESPAFKRAVPAHYFACQANSECMMVQGWCATFAINKTYAKAYEMIPPDPNGKAASRCPPGWLPPNPRPACVQNQCVIESGQQR